MVQGVASVLKRDTALGDLQGCVLFFASQALRNFVQGKWDGSMNNVRDLQVWAFQSECECAFV
jgi:hypothetical protein